MGASHGFASDITWTAETPSNDIEDSSNWNPASVPGSGDNAIFNSTLPNVSLNPTESTASFSVLNIQFTAQASPFTFAFNNQQLSFNGTGITGTNTNTTINSINTNNGSSPPIQVYLGGANSSLGSVSLNVTNSATSSGAGFLNTQLQADGILSVGDQGSITISNQGTNTTGVTSASIGRLTTPQFNQAGAFQAGDNVRIEVANEGTIGGVNGGNNYLGAINGPQIAWNSEATLGDNVQITLSNEGTVGGVNTGGENFIGYLNEQQFYTAGTFQAGNNLSLTATNTGYDNSTGNNIVGNIDSNSGNGGNQIEFGTTCSLGNNVTMSATNNGTFAGTATTARSNVANLNAGQLDFTGPFTALDNLSLTASNIGLDSSVGVGGNAVGAVSAPQIYFENSCTLGNNASISIANSGTFTGQNSGSFNVIGGLGAGQMAIVGALQAGNDFQFSATNTGNNSGGGTQANYIANTLGNNQITWGSTTNLGSGASIHIQNQAINSSTSTLQAYVGSFVNGYQFRSVGAFAAGDNLVFSSENSGVDTSLVGNISYVGVLNNGVQFDGTLTVGNSGSISISNSGSYTGSNSTQGNIVGVISAGNQFSVSQNFTVGDSFNFQVENSAVDSSEGGGSNSVGFVNLRQARFMAGCSIGNDATFSVTNQATYSGENSTNTNFVGYIGSEQLLFDSTLTVGNGLKLEVNNSGSSNNAGLNNFIGTSDSQLSLSAAANFGNDCSIAVNNEGINQGTGTGSVVGSIRDVQVLFSENVTSGSQLNLAVSNSGNNSGDINNTVGNVIGSQLLFQQGATTQNGSSVSVSNNGAFSGIDSGSTGGSVASFENQLQVTGNFQAGNDFGLDLLNVGSDSGSGTGNRLIGSIDNQASFLGNCTFGSGASINVSNTGNYSGSNTTTGNEIGLISNKQFSCAGSLTAEDNFALAIRNSGVCNTTGQNNQVASLANPQLTIASNWTIGNGASIFIANSGVNQGTGILNDVGCIANTQALFSNPLISGSHLSITVSNTGSNSGDINNCVANITGSQLLFSQPLTMQNNSSLTIVNSGSFSGADSGSTGGSVASFENQLQVPANFIAGSGFGLTISNSGSDSGSGVGNRLIGSIDAQAKFLGNCTFGSGASMKVANTGNYTGANSTTGNKVGLVAGQQFSCAGSLTAGDDFGLEIRNSGICNTAGQNNQVADLVNPQLSTENTWTIGTRGTILIANSGISEGTGILNKVGCIANTQALFSHPLISGSDLSIAVSNTGMNSGDSNNCVANITGSQLLFSQPLVIGNSSSLTIANSGSFSGFDSGNTGGSVASFENQLQLPANFIAGSGFGLTISNSGSDSGSGVGNRLIGSIDAQAKFLGNCNLGSGASIKVTNTGNYTGANSTTGNQVGFVASQQFSCAGSLTAGDDFGLEIRNSGVCSATGQNNQVADLPNPQLSTGNTWTIGKGGAILIANSGMNEGTGILNKVGCIANNQALFSHPFISGSNLSLTIANTGSNSGDINNCVANMSGSQLLFSRLLTLQNDSSWTITNSGSFSGVDSGSTGGSVASLENQLQISANFVAGSNFSLTISNSGSDGGRGGSNRLIGSIDAQAQFLANSTFGDHASLSVTNTGANEGIGIRNQVGCIDGSQLVFSGGFTSGSKLKIHVSNIANNSGSINNCVATITGSQLLFQNGFTTGKESLFLVRNIASFSGNDNGAEGSMGVLDKQLQTAGIFQVGKGFKLHLVNKGKDTGEGTGNHMVGAVAEQATFLGPCTFGENGTVYIKNKGKYLGSNSTFSNVVGGIENHQLSFQGLKAGSHFHLQIVNKGKSETSGTNNQVGHVGTSQLVIEGASSFGKKSQFFVENRGIFNGSGKSNEVACINHSQVLVEGQFSFGSNFKMSVVNQSLNQGDESNHVAWIDGSQMEFQKLLKTKSNFLFTAFNSGVIAHSQMFFKGGLEILKGQGTLLAVNQGTIGDAGINIEGNGGGGDVNIVLKNSSMKINTTKRSFTIGSLNGDKSSFVQSKPLLIIDTNAKVTADFAGDIQNFPATKSSLTKKGAGTQILSGKNTFTGPTNIEEGNLVLTGSLARDVNVQLDGTLKGTGTIGRELLNKGTVSPGLSIGTLTVLGNFVNNGGLYDVEINAKGESDLIDVKKQAILDGGKVKVTMLDSLYLFQHPYTIIRASKVKGKFSHLQASVDSALVAPTLKYGSHHVNYVIQQDLEKAAETDNQNAAAIQLDAIHHPTVEQNLLLNYMVHLPFARLRDALDSLSGYQHTDDFWIAQTVSAQFFRRLYDPIRPVLTAVSPCCDPICSDWTGWIEGDGGEMNFKGSHHEHRVKIRKYEILGGLQRTFFQSWTVGIAGGHQHNHLNYKQAGSGKNNIGMVGLYALYRPSFFYGLTQFNYSYSSNRLNRHIEIGEIDDRAKSKPKISQFGFYGEVGCDFFVNRFLFQPFIGIQTGNFCRHRVKEHDQLHLSLDIHKKDWMTKTSRLGVHLTSHQEECAEVSFDLAWNYLFSKSEHKMRGRFNAFGDDYSIKGNPLNRNSIDFAVTLINHLDRSLYVYLEVSGQWWKNAHSVDMTGGVEFSW